MLMSDWKQSAGAEEEGQTIDRGKETDPACSYEALAK
jgi:hypothetical protein